MHFLRKAMTTFAKTIRETAVDAEWNRKRGMFSCWNFPRLQNFSVLSAILLKDLAGRSVREQGRDRFARRRILFGVIKLQPAR